jgi:hypothetical protein
MDEVLKQAYHDWNSGRAYIDNNDNYHVRNANSANGKIAPWNKVIKHKYRSVTDFHNDAQKLKRIK